MIQRASEGFANGAFVLVFDFNTGSAALAGLNIVPPGNPNRTPAKTYGALSEGEKAKFIFEPFLRLFDRSFNPKRIIHIDHHYDSPVVAQTSTTVFIVDFLLWLTSDESPVSASEVLHIQNSLSEGFAIRDHSDADIMLSHMIDRNAHDLEFVRRVAPYIKATALFNDYLRMDMVGKRETSIIRLLFSISQGIEERIAKGMYYEDALLSLKEGIEFVLDWETSTAPSITNLLDHLQQDSEALGRMPLMAKEAMESGRAKNQQTLARLEPFVAEALIAKRNGSLDRDRDDISPGSIRRSGETLVMNFTGSSLHGLSNADALVAVMALAPELLEGVKVVIMAVESSEGRLDVKVRSISEGFDLLPVFSHMQARGPEYSGAGGRAAAGSLGKAGVAGDCESSIRHISALLHAVSESSAN